MVEVVLTEVFLFRTVDVFANRAATLNIPVMCSRLAFLVHDTVVYGATDSPSGDSAKGGKLDDSFEFPNPRGITERMRHPLDGEIDRPRLQ